MAEKENVHHQKIFCVITVARQVDGEYVFIKTEKGFRKASSADVLLTKLKKDYTTADGKFKPVEISTPQGNAVCQCEVGAFELEIED